MAKCWIPENLHAKNTETGYSTKEEQHCQEVIAICCAQMQDRFDFPKTFYLRDLYWNPLKCSADKVIRKVTEQFKLAGYCVDKVSSFATKGPGFELSHPLKDSVIKVQQQPPSYESSTNSDLQNCEK